MAGNAIEFSATPQEFTSEGIVCHRLIFRDDKRPVYYQPPQGWRCSIDGNRLRLVPPDKSSIEGEITSRPLDKPATLDDAAIAELTRQFLSALPPGSQNGVVVRQERNAMLLNNNPIFELLISYQAVGYTFQRSVLVVTTPATQIIFKFTAPKSDFDPLYRQFHDSVRTWEWQSQETP